MSNARWAKAALLALALPACATAAGSTHANVVHPSGQAAQPGSWEGQQAKADYVLHNGPRGQAAQPYAWVGSEPAYPADQHRLAQDGQSDLGGRAAQPGSFTPAGRTSSWTLAQNDARAKQ